ncbi:hypothetical protein NONO_c74940 [Nocardia nova SH22a]|uniref:Uncharacterized protein n=1 Tax=Nocardia nova SH22a TaxID=1415166 RepID=W5TSR6_9NOCA|nr:hypothetical protein [Nocardia nova]AHH22249.1 hypothetical protein NONO_c74940 [Nocardia nova SH22a]
MRSDSTTSTLADGVTTSDGMTTSAVSDALWPVVDPVAWPAQTGVLNPSSVSSV